jgi:type I restriction enzyme S subunit
MRSNYRRLGEFIQQVDVRNDATETDRVLGISIDKYFMPSVANVIGTDLSRYKLIEKGQFACNPMHVGRDEKLPVALYNETEKAIVSPAYFMFEIVNEKELYPEYLMMNFQRSEFDRECWFFTDGSVRGGITWDDICRIELPVPGIDAQKEIVKAYQVITDRIALKRRINEKLEEMIKCIYKEYFISRVKNNALPSGWTIGSLGDICSKIGSGATPIGGKTGYQGTGISLIRSTNVLDYNFSYDDLAHISDKQAKNLDNVTVQANDVLFNITGVSVARCCIVPSNVLPARVNQHVMIIRPNDGEYMSYYLLCALCSTDNKQKLLGIGQSGSTREAINKQELEKFEIVKPNIERIEEFGQIIGMIYKKMIYNEMEIRQLNCLSGILLARMTIGDRK